MGLRDHDWKLLYERDSDDLDREVLVPALSQAVTYDRKTGFFSSHSLALAAAGLRPFIANGGHMRLLVSHRLSPDDVTAIQEGYDLRTRLGELLTLTLPDDQMLAYRFKCLAWLVAAGRLDIKIALPTDNMGKLIGDHALFHEKMGLLTDSQGDRLCFYGSVNESTNAWRDSQESVMVFCSWKGQDETIAVHQESFDRLWDGFALRTLVVDFPNALRENLISFAPTDLSDEDPDWPPARPDPPATTPSESTIDDNMLRTQERTLVAFVRDAPRFPDAGVHEAMATSTVSLWPHQEHVISAIAQTYPDRYLLSDEVGLGKTIECGGAFRYLITSGRVRRVLLLVPKGVLSQWRTELREKFALPFWWYDGATFHDPYDGTDTRASTRPWAEHDLVIASSHLVRRADRQDPLLTGPAWDLIVLDEAHHARRRDVQGRGSGIRLNRLLDLLGRLSEDKTRSLLLLTATPMQIDLIETWDLLRLLDLGGSWAVAPDKFRAYYQAIKAGVTSINLPLLVALMADHLSTGGTIPPDVRRRMDAALDPNTCRRLISALTDNRVEDVRRMLTSQTRPVLEDVFRSATPLQDRMFRNSRERLREYRRRGLLHENIATRQVTDRFLAFGSPVEVDLYNEIDDYIKNYFVIKQRSSLGFVAGIYRRRLTSSLYAFAESLRARQETLQGKRPTFLQADDAADMDDVTDDEIADEIDADDMLRQAQQRAIDAERGKIDVMLARVDQVRIDSKLSLFMDDLHGYLIRGHRQAIVFTQYTDTLDDIRTHLTPRFGNDLACYSGRGGERWHAESASWVSMTKDDIKTLFRHGEIRILLCTDAASEGLNLQSAALLFNYDMPWNPMRVEQRIGRIDRIGQPSDVVEIVNYYYEGTIEADIYRALRQRIGIFEVVVGPLQPILSGLGERIETALIGGVSRAKLIADLTDDVEQAQKNGVNLDDFASSGVERWITSQPLPAPPHDIDTLLRGSRYLTDAGIGFRADESRPGVYTLTRPDMPDLTVTFLPDVADTYPETVRYLTYGDPVFADLLAGVPANDLATQVTRLTTGDSPFVAYAGASGAIVTMESLRAVMNDAGVIPELGVIQGVSDRLDASERAVRDTIQKIEKRRLSARRAEATSLLSAYLSLVAQEAQVAVGPAANTTYLINHVRLQDRALLQTLYSYANAPRTIPIDYDSTNPLTVSEITLALQAQRQHIQKFMQPIMGVAGDNTAAG